MKLRRMATEVLLITGLLAPGWTGATGLPPAAADSTVAAPADSAGTAAAAPQRDLPAARFVNACRGCHSLEGAKLNGPELTHVAAWPAEQLQAAIRRMEKNVGPLSDGDVADLVALLKDPTVRERTKAEAARIEAQFAARLAPADAARGERLFTGSARLSAGGLACAACHSAAGRGGSLGPDLSGAAAKMGEMPLASAIEQSAFRVMAPHYRRHPVSKQEALHLARYLATLTGGTTPPGAAPAGAPGGATATAPSAAPTGAADHTLSTAGVGGALAGFILLASYYRRLRARRPERLPEGRRDKR